MSLTALTFTSVFGVQTVIGSLQLDALISEETSLDSYATVYPVEEGGTVSDHVSNDAETLSLSGMVTTAQITVHGAHGWQKLVQAKDILRRLHQGRELVTISTGMDTYTEMVMERCRIGRTNEGDHFAIDCQFRKIIKAQLKTETVPEDKASEAARGKAGSTGTSGGKASTQPLPTEGQKAASDYVEQALELGGGDLSPGIW